MCPLRTQPGSTLAMAVMAVLLSPGAGATLIKSSGATNTACGVNAPWFWTIEPPEDGFVPSPTGPWTVSVRTAAAGGGTTVVATVQHNPGTPECDAGHGASPSAISLSIGPLVQPVLPAPGIQRSKGTVVTHGDHFDVARLALAMEPNRPHVDDVGEPGSIIVTGDHLGTTKTAIVASAENVRPGPITVTITPDYTDPDVKRKDGTPLDLGPLTSGEKKEIPVPEKLGKGNLTSVKTKVSGSPTSKRGRSFREPSTAVSCNCRLHCCWMHSLPPE